MIAISLHVLSLTQEDCLLKIKWPFFVRLSRWTSYTSSKPSLYLISVTLCWKHLTVQISLNMSNSTLPLKLRPLPLCPPQVSYRLVRYRTRVFAVADLKFVSRSYKRLSSRFTENTGRVHQKYQLQNIHNDNQTSCSVRKWQRWVRKDWIHGKGNIKDDILTNDRTKNMENKN